MKHRKKGRPMNSRSVRVTPEFREEPDIEKLGRALIAVAMKIAEKKRLAEQTLSGGGFAPARDGEGNDMT